MNLSKPRILKTNLLSLTLPILAASFSPSLMYAQTQSPILTPGKWALTQSVEGGPMRRDPINVTSCLNEAALAQPEVNFRKAVTETSRDTPACKVSEALRSVGGVKWAVSCDNPRGGSPIAGSGQASYTATSYEATQTLRLQTPFGKFELKESIKATYIGACDQKLVFAKP
jgi:hypothetical protein